MEPDGYNRRNKKISRLLRVFTPFIILLIILVFLNYRMSKVALTRPPVAKRVNTATEQPSATLTRPTSGKNQHPAPIATAIPNATESIMLTVEPTITSIPTWTPQEVAQLAGPPPSSQFSLGSPIAFYWQPGHQLPEGYLYGLHIIDDENDVLVGILAEPNLGTGYQVHLIPNDFDLSAGDYFWQVRLKKQPGDIHLGGSESRPLRLTDALK